MKNIINMTACMMFITLSQGLFCSQEIELATGDEFYNLDSSQLAFHDVESTNNSPKNLRKKTLSQPVLSIELPDLTPNQKEEGKFQDLFANLSTGKNEFKDEEFEPSTLSFQKNNRRLLSPRNYFNESPEEFDAHIESIATLEKNELDSLLEFKGRFKDNTPFILRGRINLDLLTLIKGQAHSLDNQKEVFADEDQIIMEDIAPIEEISLNEVEEDNLPNTPEKKTAYFTVQNGVIATTALASLATSYIFLRNRK